MKTSSSGKRRLLGWALGVVVVAAIGGCSGKGGDEQPADDDEQSTPAETLSATDVEALLHVSVDAAGIVREVENRTPAEEKGSPPYLMMMTTIKGLNLHRVDAFVVVAKDQPPTPVLIADDPERQIFQSLSTNDFFAAMLEPAADGGLKLKPESTPEAQDVPDHLRDIRLKSVGSRLVASTPAFIKLIEDDGWDPQSSQVAKTAEQVRTPDSLVVVSALAKRIMSEANKQSGDAPSQTPGRNVWDIGQGLTDAVHDSLNATEAIAAGFSFPTADSREIRYLQRFDSDDSSQRAEQWLGQPADDPLADSLPERLRAALADPQLVKTIHRDGADLSVTLTWTSQDDEQILDSLGESTIGLVMQRTMQGTMQGPASNGPVATEYTATPELAETVDEANLDQRVADELRRCIFLEYASVQPDQPGEVQLTVDPVYFSNAGLTTATYSVTSVRTADGKEVFDKNDARRDRGGSDLEEIDFGERRYAPSIRVPVVGVDPPVLKIAKIEFKALVPTKLAVFQFDAADAQGTSQQQDGASARVSSWGRSSVQVRFDMPADVRKQFVARDFRPAIYAFDESERALATESYFYGGGAAGVDFRGTIAKLSVVVPVRVKQVAVVIDVDLNGGQRPKIAEQPSDDVPVRYDATPRGEFQPIAPAELDGSEVEWQAADHGFGGLRLVLPPQASIGDARWETHWFGRDARVTVTGHPDLQNGVCHWRAFEGFEQARAVVGRVKVSVETAIDHVVFEKQADGEWLQQDLPDGITAKARFDNQIVTLSIGNSAVLEMFASDETGRTLKQDDRVGGSEEGTQFYFWGQPTRLELFASRESVTRVYPFEIVVGDVDRAAFDEFRSQVAEVRKAALALIQIRAAMNEADNGYDRVAGWYFLFDDNGKPLEKIPREIAVANPSGAQQFGYEVQPYHGYFFELTQFTNAFGEKTAHMRSPDKKQFTWAKGRIDVQPLLQQAAIVAWPEDPSRPTLLLNQFGSIVMRNTAGQPIDTIPGFGELNEHWQSLDVVADE